MPWACKEPRYHALHGIMQHHSWKLCTRTLRVNMHGCSHACIMSHTHIWGRQSMHPVMEVCVGSDGVHACMQSISLCMLTSSGSHGCMPVISSSSTSHTRSLPSLSISSRWLKSSSAPVLCCAALCHAVLCCKAPSIHIFQWIIINDACISAYEQGVVIGALARLC